MSAIDILGQRLRAARNAMRPEVFQRDVAERFHVTKSAVSLWESGNTEPSLEALVEMSKWYKVSLDWLLGVEAARRETDPDAPTCPLVPLIAPGDLAGWRFDAPKGYVQTVGEYPPRSAAAMVVTSDAMGAACPRDALAVVSSAHAVRHSDIVLAAVRGGEPMIRRYVRDGADELLIADDARYPAHQVDAANKIVGRVTEVTTRKLYL